MSVQQPMGILAQSERPGFFDNEVLDEFTVPFGEWVAQMVFWINSNMDPILQAFKAPLILTLIFTVVWCFKHTVIQHSPHSRSGATFWAHWQGYLLVYFFILAKWTVPSIWQE